ncbi:hypothetical protein ACFQX6_40155 [Streptosporangium lutulentum]
MDANPGTGDTPVAVPETPTPVGEESASFEERWKATSAELEAVNARNAEMEQALANIEAERTRKLIYDEFAQASKARGIELNEAVLEGLDLSAFAADGAVNGEAIADLMDLFAPVLPRFSQSLGIGPQRSSKIPDAKLSLDVRARR